MIVTRGQEVVHTNHAAADWFGHASSDCLDGVPLFTMLQPGDSSKAEAFTRPLGLADCVGKMNGSHAAPVPRRRLCRLTLHACLHHQVSWEEELMEREFCSNYG